MRTRVQALMTQILYRLYARIARRGTLPCGDAILRVSRYVRAAQLLRDLRDVHCVLAGNACGLFYVSTTVVFSARRKLTQHTETARRCATTIAEDGCDQEAVRLPATGRCGPRPAPGRRRAGCVRPARA